jgi:nitronate monooxygenase
MTAVLPKLSIGDLVLELPIIQGGMGVGVSKASLAAAVSVEGGLGVIASVGLGEDGAVGAYIDRSSEALRTEIRKVKEQGLAVGVNIMVALSNYKELVQTCVEENVDVIISGAGLPLRLPEYAGDSMTKIVPIVSSAKGAKLICKTWLRRYNRLPDAIVAEGPLAGGHLGFNFEMLSNGTAECLEDIVSSVVEMVKEYDKPIPVIAAGGVYTHEDILKFIELGAAGVQMGTRFVATDECDASDEYKQTFVDATSDDIAIVKSPVGMPARVIRNQFVKNSQDGAKAKFVCKYKCLLSCDANKANYCIAIALLNAARGHFEEAFAMCGENASRVDKIVSVKELMAELAGKPAGE